MHNLSATNKPQDGGNQPLSQSQSARYRLRAKREQLKRPSPENQGRNLGLTVSCVPCGVDSGTHQRSLSLAGMRRQGREHPSAPLRRRVNVAHIRQSRSDSGLGLSHFQYRSPHNDFFGVVSSFLQSCLFQQILNCLLLILAGIRHLPR